MRWRSSAYWSWRRRLSCPEIDRRVLGEATPVSIRVVYGLAHRLTMKNDDEIQRNGVYAIDE